MENRKDRSSSCRGGASHRLDQGEGFLELTIIEQFGGLNSISSCLEASLKRIVSVYLGHHSTQLQPVPKNGFGVLDSPLFGFVAPGVDGGVEVGKQRFKHSLGLGRLLLDGFVQLLQTTIIDIIQPARGIFRLCGLQSEDQEKQGQGHRRAQRDH